ncbi:MAG TPA: EscU/YscU/HrcU family type III secretion system export apparatus switch protein [Magnetovibrio sp.]
MSGETGTEQPKKPITDKDLAVAISYQPSKDQAPHVVAKGQGWLAEQIIAIAEANGIEVRKDANLAQILAQVDIDSEIPLEAFTLVAEILSYVYQKNKVWPDGITPNATAKQPGGG